MPLILRGHFTYPAFKDEMIGLRKHRSKKERVAVKSIRTVQYILANLTKFILK